MLTKSLSVVSVEIGAGGVAVIVIQASDDAFGTVNFTSSSLARSVVEGQSVDLELQRSGGTLGRILIGWEIENPSGDLSPTSGLASMNVGERSTRFSVTAQNDLVCIVSRYPKFLWSSLFIAINNQELVKLVKKLCKYVMNKKRCFHGVNKERCFHHNFYLIFLS